MKKTCEIKKWGNSLGVIIPAEEVKTLNLKEGEIILLDIKKKEKVDAFGIFKDAKSFQRKDRLDRDSCN